MKAYKGFLKTGDGKLRCRDFIYEEGKTYEFDETECPIQLCWRGFHACKQLHNVWLYYPNTWDVEYHEVECGGHIIDNDNENENKICCSKITIGPKIDTSKVALFTNSYGFFGKYSRVNLINGHQGFIDKKGKLLGGKEYFTCESFSGGLARVHYLEGSYWIIDEDGNPLGGNSEGYRWVSNFVEGFAQVRRNDGKWSFVDTTGKLIGDGNCWYKMVSTFKNGQALVREDNCELHLIDTKGKIVE